MGNFHIYTTYYFHCFGPDKLNKLKGHFVNCFSGFNTQYSDKFLLKKMLVDFANLMFAYHSI